MVISAFLRTKKESGNICFRLQDGKVDCSASSDITMKVSWWDAGKECIKPNAKILPPDRTKKSDKILDIKNRIAVRYQDEKKSTTINSEWLNEVVNGKDAGDFLTLFEAFYNEKKIEAGTRKGYGVVKGMLARFELINKLHLDINTINENHIISFEKFMREEPQLVKDYPEIYEDLIIKPRGQNYINSKMKKLQAFCNYSLLKGWTNQRPFERYEWSGDVYADAVAHNIEELDMIYNAKVPSYLEVVRDIYCLHCNIGARVSDYFAFTPENVKDGWLQYIPIKGIKKESSTVFVPLSDMAKEIIEKYKGGKKLMPFININGASGYNKKIKLLLEHVGINRMVMTINTLTRKQELQPFCEFATSHTARKTFVTTVYNKVKSETIVIKMTGHSKNSTAIKRYIQVQDDTLKKVIGDVFNKKNR